MNYLWLCPICLVLAAIFIFVEKTERYVEADVIKGAASLVFVILGCLSAWPVKTPQNERYVYFILAGLAIGAVADVVLNLRYVFEGAKGKLAFLVGILVFLVGHLAYLGAVAQNCPMLPFFVAIGLVLTGALMAWIFRHVEASMVFKVFGVFYVGAIVVMNCVAIGALVAAPNAHGLIFVAGALLFLVSDVILILNTFGKTSSFILRIMNLMLYYLGQLLIALSLQLL